MNRAAVACALLKAGQALSSLWRRMRGKAAIRRTPVHATFGGRQYKVYEA